LNRKSNLPLNRMQKSLETEDENELLDESSEVNDYEKANVTNFNTNSTNKSNKQYQSISDIADEVKQRYEDQQQIDTGILCDLCKKIKFVTGVGHVCFQCNRQSCVRCSIKYKSKTKVNGFVINYKQISFPFLIFSRF
jgi:hypothetical protein